MAEVVEIPKRRATPRPKLVHQFLIVLSGTDPLVWRRIQVPERDPDHGDHESTLRWAGGSFDPEAFDPAAVTFDNPKKRWKKAFEPQP